MTKNIIVIGMGEVGQPLLEIIRERHEAVGVDLSPIDDMAHCGIMHICFPFNHEKFVAEALRYIEKYQPELTIINSTVALGTTREIAQTSGAAVVHSPVRGKHARMKEEMRQYTKYVGAIEKDAGDKACDHFESIGLRAKLVGSPEASELAKLTETTYFGLLIAWAQEVERYCDKFHLNYDEVVSFYEEISFFPPVKFSPGVIGGHCVMPNIDILLQTFPSNLLQAIVRSNAMKQKKLGPEGWLESNHSPPPIQPN